MSCQQKCFLKKDCHSRGLQHPPPPPKKTQLQSLHSNVMPTWEPTPKLNSCVIPWLNTISEYTYLYISKNISYTFLLLFKTVESLSLSLSGKYSQRFLDYVATMNSLLQMRLKLLQKEQFIKRHKQLVIWLVIKLMKGFQVKQKI